MEIFGLIITGIWIAFWAYWAISALRTRSTFKRRQRCGPMLLVLLAAVLAWAILASWLPASLLQQQGIPDGVGAGLAGISVTILGLGLAVWARVHLGKNWSARPAIQVDHKLIRTGPYRFVRNPIYTGLLVGYAGTAIVIGALWAFILILFVLVAFLGKIWAEEKFLLEEFGEAYKEYRRKVKALIPFLV